MEACVAAMPLELLKYQEYHQNFHNLIMLISGHDRLKKISASIHNQVSRFSYRSLQNFAHLNSSARYHRQIIKAVKAGDKVSACRLMKAHVLEALDVLRTMPDLQKKESDKEQLRWK
jgi:DNA-binding GntR family transcriptional regulator